ncbi:interleukin-1 receptor accessory protein-like [Bacillus rossius redtenbacheri]|uniref:interleukin-1 receptor accessory protein-like n=1 Tax=Bacillus rossius redtenbacheri TaxID=93214 RepID=UPI002FDD54B4
MRTVSCLAFVAAFTCLARAEKFEDYCAENTFDSNSTGMAFSKENTVNEYAIAKRFKSLHCCAKGYRSVEWSKDGRPYPWPGSSSSFILYPESANQTIYSRSVSDADAGNYSCAVRNDTHSYVHTISLSVLDADAGVGYSGAPLATYQPRDVFVELGGDTRIFCEAFVGRVDLPDTRNEVAWRRCDVNVSLDQPGRYRQVPVSREDDQVVGSYLIIEEVTKDDLGQYECRISTWFDAVEMPVWLLEAVSAEEAGAERAAYKDSVVVLVAVLLTVISVGALYARFGLQLRVALKDMCGAAEESDGKEYDVLVCYDDRDSSFTLGVLVPTLESRYNYRCCTHQVSSASQGRTWPSELGAVAQRSRRLLAVLSPALLRDGWTAGSLHQAFHALLRVHSKVICVALQPLPRCDSSEARDQLDGGYATLRRAVHLVEWSPGARHADRAHAFWSSVCLHLPPRPRHAPVRAELGSVAPAKRRQDSCTSLEVLV